MGKTETLAERQARELQVRERWIGELIDKQYRLYVWNDGKLQALATINGLLLATVAFLFKDGANNNSATYALIVTLGLLFLSMVICLWRTRTFPQSNRSAARWANLRSINGILSFTSWEEYRDEFVGADPKRYLNDSARQLYGMAFNNRRAHSTMEVAVWFTLAGGVALITATGAQFLFPRDMPNSSTHVVTSGQGRPNIEVHGAPNSPVSIEGNNNTGSRTPFPLKQSGPSTQTTGQSKPAPQKRTP